MAASLVALQLFSGTAFAGETRLLDVAWSGNTLVTTGGQTAATITLTNNGGQNLSHALLGIGTAPANGLLPAGITIVDAVGSDFTTYCSKTTTTISCDFGSMAAKGSSKSRSFQVIFSANTAAGIQTIPTAASVNESGNPNGSNTQVFPANLALSVAAGGCNLAATYFAPGQANKVVGDDTACALDATNKQSTNLKVNGTVVSAVFVQETDDTVDCAGFTCFGQLSVGDVAVNGTYQVIWTIQWLVPSNFNVNQFGVIHYKDGNVFDFAIQNKAKNYCKTPTSTGCFMGAPTLDGTTLTAVISTAGNGGIKGFN